MNTMNTLIALVIVMLGLATIWFAVRGVAFALRLLRPPESGRSPLPVADLRRVGAMLLVGVSGVVVATSLIAAVVVTVRPPYLPGVHATLGRWNATTRQYGTAVGHELSALRHRLLG